MHRYGEPIDEYPLNKHVSHGIEIKANNGFVPEYEEREAAVFALIPWANWEIIPWQERAAAVAHYRMHNLIESHVNDAIDSKRRLQENK